MTRFEKELNGSLGEFWKKEAEIELERVRAELASGRIIVDHNGVARNGIGRALMDDMLEKVLMVTDKVSAEATREASAAEAKEAIREYKEHIMKHGHSEEELLEMRAAFGEGTTIVNIFTGQTIEL